LIARSEEDRRQEEYFDDGTIQDRVGQGDQSRPDQLDQVTIASEPRGWLITRHVRQSHGLRRLVNFFGAKAPVHIASSPRAAVPERPPRRQGSDKVKVKLAASTSAVRSAVDEVASCRIREDLEQQKAEGGDEQAAAAGE